MNKGHHQNSRISWNIKTLLILLCGCAAGLIILEGIVRLFHLAPTVISNLAYFRLIENPKMVYELTPGALVDGGIINSWGCRGPEFSFQKPTNTIRIAMLGDSITQGLYVAYKDTFCAQLEKMLNEKKKESGSSMRYQVMDFGVGGYNMEAEVETLRTKALHFAPDIVVLNFFSNDDEPIPGLNAFFVDANANNGFANDRQRELLLRRYLFDHNQPFARAIRILVYKSKLYLFMVSRLPVFMKKKNPQQSVLESADVFRKNLSEIKALQRRHHFKFLVCIQPDFTCPDHPNNRVMVSIAKEFGYPLFEMWDYYKRAGAQPGTLKAKADDPAHPNALAHGIIAQALFAELKKHNFVDLN